MYCVCIHSRTWQQNHALCVYSHKDLTAQPCVVHMFTRQHRLEFQWRTPLTVYHVLYVYAPKRTRMAAVPCIMCIQTKPLPHRHTLCVFNQGHYHIARYYVYSTKDMTTKPCIMCTQPRTWPQSHVLCALSQGHDHSHALYALSQGQDHTVIHYMHSAKDMTTVMYYAHSAKDTTTQSWIMCIQPKTWPHRHVFTHMVVYFNWIRTAPIKLFYICCFMVCPLLLYYCFHFLFVYCLVKCCHIFI